MNILIENGTYDCHNAGDITMLLVCCERLFEHFPDAKIYIATQSPEKLKKFIPKAIPVTLLPGKLLYSQNRNLFKGLHKIIPVPNAYIDEFERSVKLNFPNFSRYFIRKFTKNSDKKHTLDAYFSFLNSIDIVVVSGGGFITDDFESHATKLLETISYINNRGKPVAFFGQGIGPITHKKLKTVTKKVISKATIVTLREKLEGPKLLHEFGLTPKQYHITGDDAISYAAQARTDSMGKAIGFNIRVANYAGVSSETSHKITELVYKFSLDKKTEILPTPISWHKNENDLDNILELLNRTRDENSIHLETAEGLRKQIALCRIVITGSYHAGVFSLSQGIPIIGLARSKYYIDKFNGLSDMFKEGVKVICFDDQDWQNQLTNALEKLWNDAEQLRPILIESTDRQIALSQEAYRNFCSKLI